MSLKNTIKSLIIGSRVLRAVNRIAGRSITILRYHSVQKVPEFHEPTIGSSIIHSVDNFYKQMRVVSRYYSPISMDDALSYLESGNQLPPYPVVITFDDGYKDNLDIVAPILHEFNIPATFYIIVDSVNDKENTSAWFIRVRKAFSITKKSSWKDSSGNVYSLANQESRVSARSAAMAYCCVSTRDEQLKRVENIERALDVPAFEEGIELMLSWNDIRELRNNGHIIGSHTQSHPNMAFINEDDARFEMEQSKIVLESKLGVPVKHFAYPNPFLIPNWNKATSALLKDVGYKTAVTCDVGCVRFGDDPLSLKRMYVPQEHDQLRWYIENTMNGNKL